jgi:hypothetical protein
VRKHLGTGEVEPIARRARTWRVDDLMPFRIAKRTKSPGVGWSKQMKRRRSHGNRKVERTAVGTNRESATLQNRAELAERGFSGQANRVLPNGIANEVDLVDLFRSSNRDDCNAEFVPKGATNPSETLERPYLYRSTGPNLESNPWTRIDVVP